MAEQFLADFVNRPSLRRCIACLEDGAVLRRFRCGCFWCRDCLRRYLEVKLRDRTSWPPKCCESELGESDVAWTESDELLEKYKRVEQERKSPDPLYCAEPRCSELLDSGDTIDGINLVICDECGTLTCRKCKQSHGFTESDCEEPGLETALQTIVRENGWQRCSGCRRIVSRTTGCNHIKCFCGHNFCYRCGMVWKTCNCLYNDGGEEGGRAPLVILQALAELAGQRLELHRRGRDQRLVPVARNRAQRQENLPPRLRESLHGHGQPIPPIPPPRYHRTRYSVLDRPRPSNMPARDPPLRNPLQPLLVNRPPLPTPELIPNPLRARPPNSSRYSSHLARRELTSNHGNSEDADPATRNSEMLPRARSAVETPVSELLNLQPLATSDRTPAQGGVEDFGIARRLNIPDGNLGRALQERHDLLAPPGPADGTHQPEDLLERSSTSSGTAAHVEDETRNQRERNTRRSRSLPASPATPPPLTRRSS